MAEQGQIGKQLRTTDGRGRSVSMIDPYTLHLLRRHEVIPAEELRPLVADLGSGLTRWTRVLFWAGVVLVVPGVIALLVHLVRIAAAGSMTWPLPKWLMLANFWVIPFVLWLAACEVRRQRIRSVMLAHRRCPHCGYDLRMLPVDPGDKATVCPECGCAWVLEPASGQG